MIENIINKSRYYINENKRRDARKLLYKYRYTKYNKKALMKTYMLSWLPKSIITMLINIRNKKRANNM